MRRSQSSFPALILTLLALGGFGALVMYKAPSQPLLQPVVPTEVLPATSGNSWQEVLQAGFGDNSTPLPTVAIPTEAFVAPTLVSSGDTNAIPLGPSEIEVNPFATATPFSPSTPTLPPPTAAVVSTGAPVTAQAVTRQPVAWQPPPLVAPLSRDALGRDHYWFQRPVDSDATNYGLFYYPFGSDGPNEENVWRIHHGIDMPNPVGQTVRAAGSGTVIWAGDGVYQNSPSYGTVVVIEHDFGYRGEPLYTIYAHLSAALVPRGVYVNAGDVIALVGETGLVSGPHVHFEVRVNDNHYRSTYNPVLWMVPYVGHGVIAGRVVDAFGDLVSDADVTVKRWSTGLIHDTTTTYVLQDNELDVRSDPVWGENFVVGDVPVGRYEIIANIRGERVSKIIDVYEGTTAFVEISPVQPATAQPVDNDE
ncbi:MAG: peptidoglycan DD-metalloendopeptidase family protein [Anaerolineae bacterium]|nr:peptidoglycan DD-metalloendopeptidase family protein [Anaerolineae bacterium]